MAAAGAAKGFSFPSVKGKSWFPGHMAKGFREATLKLKKCHCVIEVHDARIPVTGRNPNFNKLINAKPRILLLNKSDLCNVEQTRRVMMTSTPLSNFVLANCKIERHSSINKLMEALLEIQPAMECQPLNIMVVGISNVRKSSLINALRRRFLRIGKGAPVGGEPGITRQVTQFIKISKHPPMLVRDTPGILLPQVGSGEVLMKLAAIGTLKDHFIGEALIADYILHVLNQQNLHQYVDIYNLDKPCYDIEEFLRLAAERLQAYRKGGLFDTLRSANHFIRQFRHGKLGPITLD